MIKFAKSGMLAIACTCALSCQSAAPEVANQTPQPPAAAKPGFVNRVWEVSDSKEIEKGQIYVFASTGALLITSPHGTPTTGTWKYEGGVLTMVEEVSIKAQIVSVTDKELKIKIASPSPIEMTLLPAATPEFTK